MNQDQQDRRVRRATTTPGATASEFDRPPNDLSALWRDPQKRRVVSRLIALPLLLLSLTAFVRSTYMKGETFVNSFEVWGVFHYYLGAKYAPEVGYFDLYTCALESDRATGDVWHEIAGARDIRTYDLAPRSALPPCPRANFTAERWKQFSNDVEFFARRASPGYFSFMFLDKGFNAPPSWVALARPLAQVVPLSEGAVATLIFSLDVVAVLAAILLIWRTHGGSAALLTVCLAVFFFGNYGRIGGNFCQYFWFPLLVGAVVLWRSGRPAWSGGILGLATVLQAFPVFFAVPIVARGMIDFARRRERPAWLPHLKFSGALVAALTMGFLVGTGAGPSGAWNQWNQKISIHKNYLRGEIFNIGLGTLIATTVSPRLDARNYVEDFPNTQVRLDQLSKRMWIYQGTAAALLLIWVLLVVRAPRDDLFSLGFLLMYALVNLSPYYYLTLALLPFMMWDSSILLRRFAIVATVFVFVTHVLFFPGTYTVMLYFPHLLSASMIALLLIGLALVALVAYRSAAVSPTV